MPVSKPKPNSGVVSLRLGVVLHAPVCGIHLLSSTAKRFGFKRGDFLEIKDDFQDTVVVRKLVDCYRGGYGMRTNYIYVDPESAHFLGTELHRSVTISPAEYPLECP